MHVKVLCKTTKGQSRGIDPPSAIRRGEGAQMKWCQEPRCSPLVLLPHPWLRGLRSFISCTIGFFTILTLSEWFCYLFCMCVLVVQSYLTLCDPMNCSPPSSSVHGTLQARILEWVAISFSRGSSWPRDWTQVSCTAGRFSTIWTTREAPPIMCLSFWRRSALGVLWKEWC